LASAGSIEQSTGSQPGVPGGPTVRQFTAQSGILEHFDSDGIHDDYGLTALSMAYDLKAVRYDQRLAANKTTINGVSIIPKEYTMAFVRRSSSGVRHRS